VASLQLLPTICVCLMYHVPRSQGVMADVSVPPEDGDTPDVEVEDHAAQMPIEPAASVAVASTGTIPKPMTLSGSPPTLPARAPGRSLQRAARPVKPLTLRLLYVDDTALNLKIVVKMLERDGYACDTASDGAEGVKARLAESGALWWFVLSMLTRILLGARLFSEVPRSSSSRAIRPGVDGPFDGTRMFKRRARVCVRVCVCTCMRVCVVWCALTHVRRTSREWTASRRREPFAPGSERGSCWGASRRPSCPLRHCAAPMSKRTARPPACRASL
jgi:hypothetical protein